ncbi:RNA polymerase sigma-70 factor [Mucilaginibacter sp. ZT4R22]|uniref:RNA polymerase sigma-70 factor n=1 Tax=Mucilaginibacter pankratovii TaxID=2772110 RepID=A0ABR7WWD7_9SPHI|nr:RNA polymerase sigma-70 factor [Mucilaginibacter pankratovii]MBD1366598.1 RNA polymerase sigma-70 factor [Mucilaginibacter pankratovii]
MDSYRSYGDAELVDLLKSGDEAAFSQIYKRHWHPLYHHAIKMVKDEDEATDVVQEVFTALWSKSEHIKLNSSLSYYLHSCVRNYVLNLFNREKIRTNYLDNLQHTLNKGSSFTDETLMRKELSTIIEYQISLLPEKMRKVFELSRNSHLSHKEISMELAISEETVKKQIYNALKILRLKLTSLFSVVLTLFFYLFFHF